MGRSPCCSKDEGLNKGAWTALEDKILTDYINLHGQGKWRNIPKLAGLKRCGKSCRLRWLNYLRPDIKRGNITHDEEDLIVRLHKLLGNRWSLIAGRLPGRTDNEIKNYWNTILSKKAKSTDDDHYKNQSNIKRKIITSKQNDMDDPAPQQQNDNKSSSGKLVNPEPTAAVEPDSSGDDKSSSSSSEADYLPDFAMDFNNLVGDIDLSDILNSDYSELDGDISLVRNVAHGEGGDSQINLDSGFGSLELFLDSNEHQWMI